MLPGFSDFGAGAEWNIDNNKHMLLREVVLLCQSALEIRTTVLHGICAFMHLLHLTGKQARNLALPAAKK